MEQTAVTLATLITEAGTNLGSAITAAWTLMTANPFLSLVTGGGIITLGIGFFRKIKRSVR